MHPLTGHWSQRRPRRSVRARPLVPASSQYFKGRQTFSFDRVFGSDSTQIEVYNYTAKHVVEGALTCNRA